MSAGGGGGFFNKLNPWGVGGGGAPGGHQGGGMGSRGGSHPRPQGPGGGWRGVSFEDSTEYDFADDDRNLYGEGQYPPHRAFSDAEYEDRWNAIFHPNGAPPTNNNSRESMPPPETTWYKQQGRGLYPAMLNTKTVGTLYSIRMALLPQTTTPGNLCPHLKLRGTSNKAGDYTQRC